MSIETPVETHGSKLSPLTWVAIVLVVIGALNWGLVGLFRFNLVAAIFGELSAISRIIYVLVAVAGIYLIVDAARLHETPAVRAMRGAPNP